MRQKRNIYIKKFWSRVDIQVIVFVAIFAMVSVSIAGYIYWTFSFDMMMRIKEERVLALYNAVEESINEDVFEYINNPEDMETELYEETLDLLITLKNATGVLYLYTAKVNDEGQFVYVVDGLEQDLDFRYPNDPIEDEIVDEMYQALGNNKVMPQEIVHTDWGHIYVAYMPVHNDKEEVIGVVGIEFDAYEDYLTYKQIKYATIFMSIIVVILSCIFSINMFKRISNPLFFDRANQDSTTGLKNRNAYELDLYNYIARKQCNGIGVVVMDLNGLKAVNDRLGHIAGDNYIRLVSEIIRAYKDNEMIPYRIGGDEFVVFVPNANDEIIQNFIKKCQDRMKEQVIYEDMRCSVACAYCIFDKNQDETLEDTFNRADALMYEEKRKQKELNIR